MRLFQRSSEDKAKLSPSSNEDIFSLPIIEGMRGGLEEALIPSLNEQYIKRLENPRDGQGLSAIYIAKDSNVFDSRPAFNGKDGLCKVDKQDVPYTTGQYVEAKARVGQSGSGMIHREHVNQYLKEHGMSRGRAEELKGCIFGMAIIKGAESQNPDDYELKILEQDNLIAKNLRQQYILRSIEELKEYEKYKKYIILAEIQKNEYEVYYILNQKLVRVATASDLIPTIKTDNIQDKPFVIQQCLMAMNLHKKFILKNKSASLNNDSVFYDFDFESYTMFADPKRYLFDKDTKKLIPEGREWGAYYDLQRSVPPVIMKHIYKWLTHSDPDEKQQLEWSSWNDRSYDDVINEFLSADPKKKCNIFACNIHTALRLYEKTLLARESALSLQPDDQFDKVEEWYKKNETFRGCFKKVSDEGSYDVKLNIYFDQYLSSLEKRIDQLLISYCRMNMKLKDKINISQFSPAHFPFDPDPRNIDKLLQSCITIGKRMDELLGGGAGFVKGVVEHFEDPVAINRYYSQASKHNLMELCDAKTKGSMMTEFGELMRNVRFNFDLDPKGIQIYLRNLLQLVGGKESKHTALENAVQNGWYDVANMILFHSDMDLVLCDSISQFFLEKIEKNEMKDVVYLDNFLFSFFKAAEKFSDFPPKKALELRDKIMMSVEGYSFLQRSISLLTQQGSKSSLKRKYSR
jgi:hypothetical protein